MPHLQREQCVKLGILLGDAAYCLDARGRAVALANLECVFGDRYTGPQRRWIARLSYRNFARTMLDLFWARLMVRGTYENYMRPEGFAAIREQLAREGRGTVFLCVHQGNWEWASLVSGFEEFFNVVVTENFKNPRLTAIFSPDAPGFRADDDPAGKLPAAHAQGGEARRARPACSST
ncbi:MAG: hypothetical protein WDN28_05705 [Chthoniobacter sp.]